MEDYDKENELYLVFKYKAYLSIVCTTNICFRTSEMNVHATYNAVSRFIKIQDHPEHGAWKH